LLGGAGGSTCTPNCVAAAVDTGAVGAVGATGALLGASAAEADEGG
jgi:hypothetical protein